MADEPFVNTFKPMFDGRVNAPITPSAAVQRAVDFQKSHGLRTPPIYVSTAITSAGYKRDKALSPSELIRLNNEAAQVSLPP